MASLLNISRITPPTYQRSGSASAVYEAEWFVEVNDYVPAARAIALGQDTADTNRLPNRGDPFRWVSQSETYRDDGARALDFRATPYYSDAKDDVKSWRVVVRWRAPQPGQDEQPGTIGLPPLARPPEYWIEWETADKVYSEGYVVNPIQIQEIAGLFGLKSRQPGEFIPLSNTAGERFTVVGSESIPIMVKQMNVASDLVALQLNSRYENSVNSITWNCRGLSVKAHFGRFLRAETTTELFEDQWSFYRMQVRVAIGRVPFYHQHANAGFKVIVNNIEDAVFDASGMPKVQIPLADAGVAATTGLSTLDWLLFTPRDFNDDILLRYT